MSDNSPQWYLDLAGSSTERARAALREAEDYLERARELLVEAQHPPSDRLPLCSDWTFPAAGTPVHYKIEHDKITKHGTPGFGVMSVCAGVVAYADQYIVVAGIDQGGTTRWWKYDGLRNIIVGLGQIVAPGQPLGDVTISLELSALEFSVQTMKVESFCPFAFLSRRGVPGMEVS